MTASDDHSHDGLDDHDLGLSHDLPKIVERNKRWGRRGVLAVFGAAGVAALAVSCGTDGPETTSSSSRPSGGPGGTPPDQGGAGAAAGTDTSVDVADGEIPEETAGPYPGDGSNGVNVLTESGIVRSDITSSFGDASGVAEGVPVTVKLTVYDLNGDDVAAMSGAAVYLWHCNREGEYSMYSEAIADENYLRGVQETDAEGRVEFTSIFPACYSGRWPHMHFEVYQSLDDATSYTNKLRTSQLALPEDVCADVFATDGYEQSVTNLAQISLDSDGIFSDGYSLQMATVTGSIDDGYTVSLNIPV
jgi:protocatechuate 3,4-dioxygenase beta subunit